MIVVAIKSTRMMSTFTEAYGMLGPVDLRDMVATLLTVYVVEWYHVTRWCFARCFMFLFDCLRILISFHDHSLDLLGTSSMACGVCMMRLDLVVGAECRVIFANVAYVIGRGFRCGECLVCK